MDLYLIESIKNELNEDLLNKINYLKNDPLSANIKAEYVEYINDRKILNALNQFDFLKIY